MTKKKVKVKQSRQNQVYLQ